MKHLEMAGFEKNMNMNMIHRILECKRNGDPIITFQPALVIEPVVHLPIYTSFVDKHHRTGYVVDLDPCNLNIPVAARYFCENGEGSYREIDLTKGEFKDLIEYYELGKVDIWYKCHLMTK